MVDFKEMIEDPFSVLSRYYLLSTISLAFFIFLAIFVVTEFIFALFNVSQVALDATFYLAPYFSAELGISAVFIGVILTVGDAVLHFFDKKINLMLSFVPTGLMIGGLSIKLFLGPISLDVALLFVLMVIAALIDYICILNHPEELDTIGREGLEIYLEREREIESIMEKEEEKLKTKEEELEEMKTKVETLSDSIETEQEKLKTKEEELEDMKTQLEEEKESLRLEEERLKLREGNIEDMVEQKMEEKTYQEEEMLKQKEEEMDNIKTKLNTQEKLYEEAKKEVMRKQNEIERLKTEMEETLRREMEEEMIKKLKEESEMKSQKGKQKKVLFPFTAIVGQEQSKKGLILNAIYPDIGGVLLRGEKGTAKSVSVRGLAEVLPNINITGCQFNCDPKDIDNLCPECSALHAEGELKSETRPVKVVNLPLNITEDRLLGSMDIEKILEKGVKAFEPGLLAEANRGILYVDEINLLDDYIVDILLDAASSHRVLVEREGISTTYKSKFIIVGSMNPEEGDLRPQLLDRISLVVTIKGISDLDQRMEIIRSRQEFSKDPETFREKYLSKQEELKDKIDNARELLPKVSTPKKVYEIIANLCKDFDVAGHRGDLAIERAARANAAFEGRVEITVDDILAGAKMALPHRIKKKAFEEEEFTSDTLEEWFERRT